MNNFAPDTIYFYTKAMPFWGLSNFSPPGIEADSNFWPTVEHFFQAQKFLDQDIRERIRKATTPKHARELGQSRTFPLREGWDDLRDGIMHLGLQLKFSQPGPRDLLLSTGDRLLVEASPFDYYWAAGQDGSGLNRLGQLLMQVRRELRAAA